MDNYRKILIIKPSGIGDIVHSLPVAKSIKVILPTCEIHWLVFGKFADILKNTPFINKIILWDRKGGLKEFFRVVKEIRSEKYDIVIDLQVLMRTAILSFLSGGDIRISSSFVREFANIFEKPVGKFNLELHAVERNYEVIKYLFPNKTIPQPLNLLPWLTPTEEETKTAQNFLNGDKKFVAFSVGSRGRHKIWPESYYAQLINLMNNEYRITPVFVGMRTEQKNVDAVLQYIKCDFVNLTGRTDLRVLVAVLNQCQITIGNDSGVIHIAAALDKPVLGIFGATNPKWYYPYNKKSHFVYKKFKCSPCGIQPRCSSFECMTSLKVDDVFDCIKTNFESYLK